jgi:hypothetical protein
MKAGYYWAPFESLAFLVSWGANTIKRKRAQNDESLEETMSKMDDFAKIINPAFKMARAIANEELKGLRKAFERQQDKLNAKKTVEEKPLSSIAQAIKDGKFAAKELESLAQKLAEGFQVAESTVLRWVSGVARPAPLLVDAIIDAINAYAEGLEATRELRSEGFAKPEETAASVKRGLEDDAAGKVEPPININAFWRCGPFGDIEWEGLEEEIEDWELTGPNPYLRLGDTKYDIPPVLLSFMLNLFEEGKAQAISKVYDALDEIQHDEDSK